MKLFTCMHCGQLLYFENHRCEKCGYSLGFMANTLQLVPLVEQEDSFFKVYEEESKLYRYCANHQYGVCNWLIEEDNQTVYCKACTLNRTIPDLSKQKYQQRWQVIEDAKHRLVYALLRMQLPVVSKAEDVANGLSFDFLADENKNSDKKILTGHANGLITLNIAEADDIEREMARKAMAEPYRTVLGHLRHEIGHYYWDRLIDNSDHLDEFRKLFGDERMDYGEAVKRHYEQGTPSNWNETFISAYATTHPWEDWAETWAHYMHIIDTLETAYAFGLRVRPEVVKDSATLKASIELDPYNIEDFTSIINIWLPLCFALNSLNRSMGHRDLYPFIIPPKAIEKLTFIHNVCCLIKNKRTGKV
ncbi:MAG: putative zinc-binding peptidase [Bacteroidota bacterium]|nr:putative zinc-binding peptidase [Bacteroidota bacterium]